MQIEIESTEMIVTLVSGTARIPARVWTGHTATGIPVNVLVARIGVEKSGNLEQFDRELKECVPPTAEAVQAFPLRMVI